MSNALLVLCRLPLLDLLEMAALLTIGLLALAGVWVATATTVAAISALLDKEERR